MRAVVVEGNFGLDQIRVVDRPEPEPGPGEVLVELAAASLNYRDLLMVRGHYDPRQPLPLVPCSDGSGRVVAVGEDVSGLVVGDRIATCFAQEWVNGNPSRAALRSTLGGPREGVLRERFCLPVGGVVKVPAHLSDAQAATLPCAALTAWSSLVTLGKVEAGQTVLVEGTGGVSIFALQLATALGARVIVTSSSDEKLERAKSLGAWKTINYRADTTWGKTARKLSDGGVDIVVEVGGAGTLEQALKAIRPGGMIALIGVLSGVAAPFNVLPVLMNQVTIQGVFVGHREGFEAMCRAIEADALEPVVDTSFEIGQTRQALEHMAAGRHFGKICLQGWG